MDGGLVILDPETGGLLRKLKYNITRKPLLYKGRIIFGTMTGELVELDSYFTEVRKKKVAKHGLSSLRVWQEQLVVSSFGRMLHLVRLDDFSLIEKFSLGSYYSAVFGKMQVDENYLAVLSSRNRLYIFR